MQTYTYTRTRVIPHIDMGTRNLIFIFSIFLIEIFTAAVAPFANRVDVYRNRNL